MNCLKVISICNFRVDPDCYNLFNNGRGVPPTSIKTQEKNTTDQIENE